MNKYKITILSVISLANICASSQGMNVYAPKDYSIIPPSPEVSSLMKYIDFPTNPFTGQPNINLPIYTIRQGSLEVPISISYHGGGIKINEQAGIVGLGWNLNAGGCVSRTVYGYPDEAPNLDTPHEGWNSNSCHVRGLFHLTQNEKDSLRSVIMNRSYIDYSVDACYENAIPYAHCSTFEDGLIDVANDIYKFNCQGLSGTFIINPDDYSKVISTDSFVDFTYSILTGNTYDRFEMFDSYHNKYTFQEREFTFMPYSYRNGLSQWVSDSLYYVSAWHLKEIISINGDTIRFSYQEPKARKEFLGLTESYTRPSDFSDVGVRKTSGNSVVYFEQLLSEITTRSAKVTFVYDNDERNLQEINVFTQSANPTLVKKFTFQHNQMAVAFIKEDGQTKPLNKSMLASVSEVGSTNDTIKLYQFGYKTAAPYVVSDYWKAKDLWGYYNGWDNSSLLVDAVLPNRDSNPHNASNGILQTINYATGGSTILHWQGNDFGYVTRGNVFGVDTIGHTEVFSNNLRGRSFSINDLYEHDITTDYYDMSRSLYFNSDTVIYLDFSQYAEPLMSGQSGMADWSDYYHYHSEAYPDNYYPRVELYSPNNTRLKTWYIDSQTSANGLVQYEIKTSITGSGIYSFVLRNPYNFENVSLSTINGYYGVNGSEFSNSRGYVGIKTYRRRTESIGYDSHLWGGLRIGSIESTCQNALPLSKTYYYRDNKKTLKSSGVIAEGPSFISNQYTADYAQIGEVLGLHYRELVTESSDGFYSTPLGGPTVEYPVVWEVYGDSLSIQYIYDSQKQNELCDVKESNIDFIPATSRIYTSQSHKRGNLREKNYYKNDMLYKSEFYDYLIFENDNRVPFCSDFTKFLNVTISSSSQAEVDYATSRYYLIPYNKLLARQETREYNPITSSQISNTTPHFQQVTNMTYFIDSFSDNPHATLLRSEKKVDSDGEPIETFFSYYTYSENERNFPLNIVETEVTVKGNTIVKGRRYKYDNCNRLIETYLCHTGRSTDNLGIGENYATSDQLRFALSYPEYDYSYDEDGHLVEISYKGFILASYLWAYNGSHPIAEIKGVSYSNVCASLPADLQPTVLLNRYDITDTDLAAIRDCFPSKNVTTFTYDWLIGIGTMTDNSGITTEFTYDDFGRLSTVKDVNGYFIRKYEYLYWNQQ